MVGLGLSFENSRLDLDREMRQSPHFWCSSLFLLSWHFLITWLSTQLEQISQSVTLHLSTEIQRSGHWAVTVVPKQGFCIVIN